MEEIKKRLAAADLPQHGPESTRTVIFGVQL
jgi:hypothetical protein